ncbi:CheR family methyltransferase [Azonexus sp.]|uniref:CheR family methyltransferase n=1 Tax=Azonexus sp. TaxID=1872668 RepID=UPI0027B92A59|nr:CheR family methyltransferase [Azonexus sp.]
MSFDLSPFKVLIKERCGLLFEGDSTDKLAHALKERMAVHALASMAYYAMLQGNDGEFQELVNLLTINETYFFREPEQIRLLVDHLAPRFLAAHDGKTPVRILSAGCSSGEEPYSLAMALLDKYGTSVGQLFAFAGGDIDSTVLTKARNARYTDFSFRGVPEEIKQRYFDKDRWGRVLKEQVRSLVSFHELNLLASEFPPALHDFDIIFFRNVSIYFDTPTRKIIQRNLASLMKDDGILVIGTAETLANDLGVLPQVEENGLFYFVKGKPPLPAASIPVARPAFDALTAPLPPAPLAIPSAVPLTPLPIAPPISTLPVGDFELARQLTCDKRYDEALPQLDAVLSIDPGHAAARLLKAYVLINRKDFGAAEALAQRVLAADTWSIDALLLLGLAAKWRKQTTESIRCFKQAAYTRHECWPAHYYLADLYRHSGEQELARRAYRVVVQLLSGSEPDTGIRHIPLGLPASEVRFLCEHQLAKLPAGKLPAGQK